MGNLPDLLHKIMHQFFFLLLQLNYTITFARFTPISLHYLLTSMPNTSRNSKGMCREDELHWQQNNLTCVIAVVLQGYLGLLLEFPPCRV